MTDTFTTFDALHARLVALYEDGEYAEALALAQQHMAQYPDQVNFLREFGASMAGRLGDADTALRLLRW